MSKGGSYMNKNFKKYLKADLTVDETGLRQSFVSALPDLSDADRIFEDTLNEFDGEELIEVCREVIDTVTAECSADDFHNWNYDHLEFIIDLSNRYNFVIPRNLLNGLPEQLILLVDADKLSEPGCP
jgi:hypothetical protein